MPAPRAPGAVFLSKNQTRQMENRNNAQQQALYAAAAFGSPFTIDPGVGLGTYSVVGVSPLGYVFLLTRLKNYRNQLIDNLSLLCRAISGTAVVTVCLCSVSVSGDAISVTELARCTRSLTGTVLGLEDFNLSRQVQLSPSTDYCVALNISTAAPDGFEFGVVNDNAPGFCLRYGASANIASLPVTFTRQGSGPWADLGFFFKPTYALGPFFALATLDSSSVPYAQRIGSLWY